MPLKMQKRLRRLAAGLLTLLLLLSCTGCEQIIRTLAFTDFILRADDRKWEFCEALPPDISDYTPDLAAVNELLTKEELDLLITPTEERTVTADEARADVDLAFRLLAHAYGAYDYFGGDAVFAAMRKEAMDALSAEGETVSASDLTDILVDVLDPALRDGHLYIGSGYYDSPWLRQCWYVPDLYFNDATEVSEEVADYVRVTVDESGRLRFCLVAYVTKEESLSLPVSAKIAGESVPLNWTVDLPDDTVAEDAYAESTLEGGIPYLAVSRMEGLDEEEEEQLDRFAQRGSDFAQEPILVLDLRGNEGGFMHYGYDWFTNFTGEYPMIPESSARKFTELTVHAMRTGDEYSLEEDDFAVGEWDRCEEEGWYTPRDGFTFILADQYTASAAETLLLYALTLEDAIIVGGNSSGCCLTFNPITYYLPRSGVPLYFGTALSLVGDMGNFDGIGIAPDIWTPQQDAADAVCRLIGYYGLGE